MYNKFANDNIKRYQENFHFYGIRDDEPYVYREGRAVDLPSDQTIELTPTPILYTYISKKGPFIFYDKNNGRVLRPRK